MNRTYKLSTLWMMCLMLISCLSFTACDNGDDENTNQYTGGVKLNVFGPCPVARGGELRFLGSGMDQVTGVVIPGCDEITDIKLVSKTEIRVTVPQTAEEGLVMLHSAKGDLTTKTKITYTEPISIEAISPGMIKPGAVLTISGEYLNLIKEVIFADEVVVTEEDFAAHNRKEIQVVVPEEAQTGKIVISDGAEIPNWIYSEEELRVVLPSVEEVLDLTDAKPGDEITITGKDLDLVRAVEMPNGEAVEFEVKEDKLTFILSGDVSNGEIVMTPASGVKVVIATVGVAVPTELVATPATGLRAADIITITGVNMELVTSVTFPGMEEAVEPTSQSATQIKVVMPEAATSGDLILNTASGNTASVNIETQKPEVLSYAETTVPAGESVVLKGKNLDLIAKVIFGGDKTVEVTPVSATELVVAVPVDAESGELIVVMSNGETTECPVLTVSKPEFCYIPVLPGEDVEIHAGGILAVEVENGDKLTRVQVNGEDVQFILYDSNSKLHLGIPNRAANATQITLISSNGQIDYTVKVIPAGIVETVIMDEIRDLGSWAGESAGGAFRLYKESFEEAGAGSILKFYFSMTSDQAQVQLNNANWSEWETLKFEDPTETSYEYEMTQEFLDHIMNADDGWSSTAMVIQGEGMIVSKVSIIVKRSSEITVMEEERDLGSWAGEGAGGAFRVYRDSWEEAEVAPKVGSTLKFYVNVYSDSAKMQINNANWGEWNTLEPEQGTKEIEVEVDAPLLDALLNVEDGWSTTALVIQGEGIIVKKVTLTP